MHVGDFGIGFTTSYRMGQLLVYGFDPPKRHPDTDVMTFMATVFIEAVRRRFKDGGYTSISDHRESGGDFLVGVAGRLFHIYSDFQVAESLDAFDACGCGEPYALAALRNSTDKAPRERLLTALETAAHFSAGVRAPFHFVTVE